MIDLSPEALHKRRNIAQNAAPGPWNFYADSDGTSNIEQPKNHCKPVIGRAHNICVLPDDDTMKHIAASSPDAVIAMIDEIGKLRSVIDSYENLRSDYRLADQKTLARQELERLSRQELELLKLCGHKAPEKGSLYNFRYISEYIESLRSENTRLHQSIDQQLPKFFELINNFPQKLGDELCALKKDNERLQKEADWLAEQIAGRTIGTKDTWRKSAQISVEALIQTTE